MIITIVRLTAAFREHWRGGAGPFRSPLDRSSGEDDGPLAFERDKIQLGLVRHGLQILARADRLRLPCFSDTNHRGEGARAAAGLAELGARGRHQVSDLALLR